MLPIIPIIQAVILFVQSTAGTCTRPCARIDAEGFQMPEVSNVSENAFGGTYPSVPDKFQATWSVPSTESLRKTTGIVFVMDDHRGIVCSADAKPVYTV
ncbi:MAG: hypothetical protein HOL14_00875, partial [Phycisphaerae bacterium]|nr:hypothetical protein [Phycisphaerae bacterium]